MDDADSTTTTRSMPVRPLSRLIEHEKTTDSLQTDMGLGFKVYRGDHWRLKTIDGNDRLATPEERYMWDYIKHLEGQIERMSVIPREAAIPRERDPFG